MPCFYFHTPLEARDVSIASIHDELEEAVEYARKYMPIVRDIYSYRRIWYILHTCPDCRK